MSDAQMLEGDSKLLVGDSAVWPVFAAMQEGFLYFFFGETRGRPIQGR